MWLNQTRTLEEIAESFGAENAYVVLESHAYFADGLISSRLRQSEFESSS